MRVLKGLCRWLAEFACSAVSRPKFVVDWKRRRRLEARIKSCYHEFGTTLLFTQLNREPGVATEARVNQLISLDADRFLTVIRDGL